MPILFTQVEHLQTQRKESPLDLTSGLSKIIPATSLPNALAFTRSTITSCRVNFAGRGGIVSIMLATRSITEMYKPPVRTGCANSMRRECALVADWDKFAVAVVLQLNRS